MKAGKRKRISLFLALCMLLNVTAVPTWAEQKETVSTKDNTVKTATSSDAQVQEEEKGDEEEVLKKTVEEEEKDEAEEQIFEAETVIIPTEDIFADLPDNDELFAGYVEKTLYGNDGIVTYGNWGEERLEGTDLQIYNILKNAIKEIAAGNRSSTIIDIPVDNLRGLKTEWTEAEAGVSFDTFDTAMLVIRDKIIDTSKILRYLMVDCPYELYWYNKSSGGTIMDGPTFSYTEGSKKTTVKGSLEFSMTVVNAYQGGNKYSIDTRKAKSVQTAVDNAKKIAERYSGKSDEEKLLAYKDEICELVSYNTAAAGTGYTGGYGDPWQLIYVFDGDKTTNVVCEGYAKAFQYLCDLSVFSGDVTCYTVNGTMSGGTGAGPHMWNIVTIEGDNYLADVTNCDTGTVGAPDRLFLAGTAGSVSSGYRFTFPDIERTITYTYSRDMSEMYGDILKLADSSLRESPVLSKIPAGTAVYDQTLNDVHLENPSGNTSGIWKWQTPDAKVGDVGSRKFKADFIPDDTRTYRIVTDQEITVTVSQKEVANPEIVVEEGPHDYTGSQVTPKITLKDGTVVIPESEYTVSFSDNISIGTATVIVSNKSGGNYLLPERCTENFTIVRADLSRADLEIKRPEGGYVFDKKKKEPSVTVKIKGTAINPDWYKVSYANNINAGETAEVMVTGTSKEFCLGTKSATFTIAKKPVKITASAEDKTYDGKPDAKAAAKIDNNEESQIFEGDEVELGEITALFTDITPGTDKDVTVTASLTGKDAGNYEVKPTTVKAAIHAYDPKEVKEAIEKAEAAKEGVQGINKQASSVTQGIRFVSTAQLKAMNDAIEKAKTAIAVPVTAEQAEVLAAELAKATETFTNAIQTGTYKSSSGGSSGGGGGGGGGGGSRGTTSSRTNSTSGPGSPQGTVSFDSRKGQVNSVTGIVAGTTNGAAGDGYSHWQQGNLWDNSSWKLQYADGSYAAGAVITDAAGNMYEQVAWEMINGSWYAFGADAIAKNSWVLDVGAGRWYYVDISSGMKTGWIALNGLWYYLNSDTTGALQKPFGAMYQNEMTPDGYFVNADGSWNGVPKN